MISDMLSFFNLTQLPFTKEIPAENLMKLPSIEKHIKSLNMLIELKSIGLVTGQSGAGKSSLVRMLVSSLNSGLFLPVYICHTSVSLTEFYSHLCSVFGLEPQGRRSSMFRKIRERITEMNSTNRIHPVIVIDEAHLLRNEILSELRLLLNFEIDSVKGATVILCGQNNLKAKLGLKILEPLANSVSISIDVRGLSLDETFMYIEQRINYCGNSVPIFTKNAIQTIHKASGGIFRVIGKIAQAALLKAYEGNSPQVENEHVTMCLSR